MLWALIKKKDWESLREEVMQMPDDWWYKRLALVTAKGAGNYLLPDFGSVLSESGRSCRSLTDEQFAYLFRRLGVLKEPHFRCVGDLQEACEVDQVGMREAV